MTTHEPICKTDAHGNKYWYLNGNLHRTDGPALELINGDKHWYLNGKYVSMEDVLTGTKVWYLNNELVEMEDVLPDPKDQFWWRMKS